MEITTLPNLRDVGGHPTADGRTVRAGVIFRSVDLGRLDATGIAQVSELGVRTVYDLRTAAERHARPDRLPSASTRSRSTSSPTPSIRPPRNSRASSPTRKRRARSLNRAASNRSSRMHTATSFACRARDDHTLSSSGD